jgi:hypothetical protein
MLLLTREVRMTKDMKNSKLKRLPQTDARSAWRVVGKQIGRAIQEGARTSRLVNARDGGPVSGEPSRTTPIAAKAVVSRECV